MPGRGRPGDGQYDEGVAVGLLDAGRRTMVADRGEPSAMRPVVESALQGGHPVLDLGPDRVVTLEGAEGEHVRHAARDPQLDVAVESRVSRIIEPGEAAVGVHCPQGE